MAQPTRPAPGCAHVRAHAHSANPAAPARCRSALGRGGGTVGRLSVLSRQNRYGWQLCYRNVTAILRRHTKSCLLCFFNNFPLLINLLVSALFLRACSIRREPQAGALLRPKNVYLVWSRGAWLRERTVLVKSEHELSPPLVANIKRISIYILMHLQRSLVCQKCVTITYETLFHARQHPCRIQTSCIYCTLSQDLHQS